MLAIVNIWVPRACTGPPTEPASVPVPGVNKLSFLTPLSIQAPLRPFRRIRAQDTPQDNLPALPGHSPLLSSSPPRLPEPSCRQPRASRAQSRGIAREKPRQGWRSRGLASGAWPTLRTCPPWALGAARPCPSQPILGLLAGYLHTPRPGFPRTARCSGYKPLPSKPSLRPDQASYCVLRPERCFHGGGLSPNETLGASHPLFELQFPCCKVRTLIPLWKPYYVPDSYEDETGYRMKAVSWKPRSPGSVICPGTSV